MGENGVADTLFVGGTTYEPGAATSRAGGVAVRGGRIVATGTDEELADLRGAGTVVVDLPGGLLLPGFQDAHVHPVCGGTGSSASATCTRCTTAEEYLAAVAAYARAHPERRRGSPAAAGRMERVPRRDAAPRAARRRRPGPPGLPAQPRPPRRLGQQPRAGAGRDHPGHPGPGRRPDRARRRRRRRPACCRRARDLVGRAACPPPTAGRARPRAADGAQALPALARHHRLAGRDGRRGLGGPDHFAPTCAPAATGG